MSNSQPLARSAAAAAASAAIAKQAGPSSSSLSFSSTTSLSSSLFVKTIPAKMSDSSEQKSFTLQTASFDARFPNQNQTKHCWQNYVDYYRCVNAKGEDFVPCKQFFRAYNSLCPNEWGVDLIQAPRVGCTQLEEATSTIRLGSSGRCDTFEIARWDEQRENNNFAASLEP
ncbi:hypothetical protein PaG_00750 [Moesziomyces aphidis]|uniref:Cytochrome c oxidase subunit 12, mitochondrial n=1 Tax=Moesziomyces aphidis TaxID=84754 RepID=W3VVF1_MOEAP|nr:hypothetical protein PaG_00750 [Moesziomyces aphidis]